jgi:hypothetical protein
MRMAAHEPPTAIQNSDCPRTRILGTAARVLPAIAQHAEKELGAPWTAIFLFFSANH